jgi:hypothetical protein
MKANSPRIFLKQLLHENIDSISGLKWVELLNDAPPSIFDKIYDSLNGLRASKNLDWPKFMESLPTNKKLEIYKQIKNK